MTDISTFEYFMAHDEVLDGVSSDELVAVSRGELAQIEVARIALYKLLEKQCADTGFLTGLNKITDPLWEVANKKRATLAGAAPPLPVAESAEPGSLEDFVLEAQPKLADLYNGSTAAADWFLSALEGYHHMRTAEAASVLPECCALHDDMIARIKAARVTLAKGGRP